MRTFAGREKAGAHVFYRGIAHLSFSVAYIVRKKLFSTIPHVLRLTGDIIRVLWPLVVRSKGSGGGEGEEEVVRILRKHCPI